MPNELLLPPIPTTNEQAALYKQLKIEWDPTLIRTLYDPELCPERMLVHMYEHMGAAPLYYEGNPEDTKRNVYRALNLYRDDFPDGVRDGILGQKGGERALGLFASALGVAYSYTFRRATSGRPLGITLFITPYETTRDYFNSDAAAQEYLKRAFEFLLPDRLVIDDVIYAERFEIGVGVNFYLREWVYTE